LLNIAVMGDAVVANINKIVAQLDGLPSSVDGTVGTETGLGRGFGQSLVTTGSQLQYSLDKLVWAMTQHQASIRAAVQALSDADEISKDDADQILKTIDDTIAHGQSSSTETSGATTTATAGSDTASM